MRVDQEEEIQASLPNTGDCKMETTRWISVKNVDCIDCDWVEGPVVLADLLLADKAAVIYGLELLVYEVLSC